MKHELLTAVSHTNTHKQTHTHIQLHSYNIQSCPGMFSNQHYFDKCSTHLESTLPYPVHLQHPPNQLIKLVDVGTDMPCPHAQRRCATQLLQGTWYCRGRSQHPHTSQFLT
mmetsp:Transcript_5354/g.11725  ORF Transcript_5354/g.11725 Transcript_5354/m.11725 type:complete len:111 (+) Transcript_5354:330-662(+)